MRKNEQCPFSHNDILLGFLIQKKYRVFRHAFIILLLFLVFFNLKQGQEYAGNYDYYASIFGYLVVLGMFYINMYVLIPRLLYQKKHIKYLFLLTGLIVLGFLFIRLIVDTFFEPYRIKPRLLQMSFYRELLFAIVLWTPFLLSNTALKLFQRWIIDSSRINELEKHAMQIELKVLRNQINPHFLFNMLNSVHVLIKKNPEKASLVTVKLSDFLRYQLYDNNQSKVFLQAEIKFITDFLNLEKIRRDDFQFSIKHQHTKGVQLPPNLFTSFIENAVKHSVDTEAESFVSIQFAAKNQTLIFSCKNSKPQQAIQKSNKHGLGLVNSKRRLELLYQDKYELIIKNEKTEYTLTLKLPL